MLAIPFILMALLLGAQGMEVKDAPLGSEINKKKGIDSLHYFNALRAHAGLEGRLPETTIRGSASPIDFGSSRWQKHCRGLYQTPIAA
jgi:hypothetical protein